MKDKEFTLSERIRQLKLDLQLNAKLSDGQIDGIIRMIIFMDKEFIKRLKKRIDNNLKGIESYAKGIREDTERIINKAAGDKFK